MNKILSEDTKNRLISKSRNVGDYKNPTYGKNRFERKKYSKLSPSAKDYNKLDMNKLFKQDILEANIPVMGETDNYTVTIRVNGVVAEIQKNIKSNNNIFEYRTVFQALTKQINTSNVYVKCTCKDYEINFAHWNIVNRVSVDDSAHDPGPGKGKANPEDKKGRGCKHVMLVLTNLDWVMKIANVIYNYINFAESKLQKPFLALIFPKLYGVVAEDMVKDGLVDNDKYTKNPTGLIQAINKYSRTNRQKASI